MARRKDGGMVPNEERILVTAWQLHQAGQRSFHGYVLNAAMAEARRGLTISTLYRCLGRLEDRGLLESEYRPSEGRGPGTRTYSLTGVGVGVASSLDVEALPIVGSKLGFSS